MPSILRALPVAAALAALVPVAVSASSTSNAPSAMVPGQQTSGLWSQADPVRVMPLGDSNTAGADSAAGGYRTDLWQLLRADGRSVDFVGSQRSGSPQLGDHDHEGHGSWTISMVHNNIVGWLQAYQPQVVLLQIGTNDVPSDEVAAGAPARLSALLDRIAETAPATRVHVTSLPPINDAVLQRRIQAINATIPGMVAAKAGAGKLVSYVDTGSVFVAAHDFVDIVHPSYGAASRAAARWFTALTGVPLTRYEAEQTANASLVRATRVSHISASGGVKVGYIDFADSKVDFTVHAAANGRHRIRIRSSNGMGQPCSHQLSVNNGVASTVTYPAVGWDQWAYVGADVVLGAGPNSLKLTKGACYTEIDAIDVSGPAS